MIESLIAHIYYNLELEENTATKLLHAQQLTLQSINTMHCYISKDACFRHR